MTISDEQVAAYIEDAKKASGGEKLLTLVLDSIRSGEKAIRRRRNSDLEDAMISIWESMPSLLAYIGTQAAELLELRGKVGEQGAEIERLKELAYDQHGDEYRERFRNQMLAASDLIDHWRYKGATPLTMAVLADAVKQIALTFDTPPTTKPAAMPHDHEGAEGQ